MRTWIHKHTYQNHENENRVNYEENETEWEKYKNYQSQRRNQMIEQNLQPRKRQRQQNRSRNTFNQPLNEEPTQLSGENIPLRQPQTRYTNPRLAPPMTPTLRKRGNLNTQLNDLLSEPYKLYIEPQMQGAPKKRTRNQRNENIPLTFDLFQRRRLNNQFKKYAY